MSSSMLSYIVSIIDVRTVFLITALTLLIKFILDKYGLDPYFREIDSQVPGPFALPIFGNSLNFILAGKNGLGDLQAKYIQKYGRIYKTWIGNQFVVQLSHPDDLEAVFLNSKALGKGELLRSYTNCFGNGLFTDLNVSNWKNNRKRLEPYFTKDVIKCLAPSMNKTIYKFMETLKEHANGSELEMMDLTYNLSLNFITSTAYGSSVLEKNVIKLRDKLDSTFDILNLQMFFPFLNKTIFRVLIDKLYVMPARNYFLNFIKEVISKRISDIEKGTIDSAEGPFSTKLLLTSYKLAQTTGNEDIMLDEIMTLILAAGDTTSRTIANILLMLAMHPDIQKKVYEEIYEIFGDDDRQAELYDCDNLPYLDQVIKETLRRFTLLPMVFRKASDNVKIGRYIFPPETQFMINVGGIHFNPEYYPNPYEFNPENFTVEAIRSRHKYSYLPFGAGPRNCIGKNLAEFEIKLALTTILRTFTVHTKQTMNDLNVSIGVLQRNINGTKLSFKLRKPNK